MKKITSFCKNLWNDEAGQGTAEYVLLLVIIVALVLAFQGQIKQAISQKMSDVQNGMGQITTGQ